MTKSKGGNLNLKNITTALLFATVVVIVIIGCDRHLSNPILNGTGDPDPPMSIGERESGTLYKLGEVLVQYDYRTFTEMIDTTPTPIVVVNEFLISKGYTPRIVNIFSHFNVEVIDIGEDIDPAFMFEELKALPGVIDVQRNILYDILERLSGDIPIPVTPSILAE